MTALLFRDDAYQTEFDATVTAVNDRGGIVLDGPCSTIPAAASPATKAR